MSEHCIYYFKNNFFRCEVNLRYDTGAIRNIMAPIAGISAAPWPIDIVAITMARLIFLAPDVKITAWFSLHDRPMNLFITVPINRIVNAIALYDNNK